MTAGTSASYDVLILGGGPAGTTAALVLARAGLRVAVLERSEYAETRVGETFPPDICAPLQRLGLWETFRQAGHREAPGILSCWGSDEPYENDFIFNPFGCGWHVDRVRFDRMLAEASQSAGAALFLNTRVIRCELANEFWRVRAERQGKQLDFCGTWLIDAAGRAGRPGASTQRAVRHDRLVACLAFFQSTGVAALHETRTVIEARPQGWWYSAPLPDNRLVMAWMTDADLLPATHADTAAVYWQRLQETSLTKRWLAGFAPRAAPRRVAAHTSFRAATGPRWLAVGDAALAFDPLSSQGTLKALVYGEQAAQALLCEWHGDTNAVTRYAAALTAEFERYWRLRRQYYARETRWAHAPFWQRRQTSS